MKTQAEVRELKVNGYLTMDNEPCKILSISISKPGKHGEAKARIEAVGVFDSQKRSVVHPVKHKVSIPIISKRNAQVLALVGDDQIQLMDLESYETFEIPIGSSKAKIEPGREVIYIETLGRRKLQ